MDRLVLIRVRHALSGGAGLGVDLQEYAALATRLADLEVRPAEVEVEDSSISDVTASLDGDAAVYAVEYASTDPFRLGFLCAQLLELVRDSGRPVSLIIIRIPSVDAFAGSGLTELILEPGRTQGPRFFIADDERQGWLAQGGLAETEPSELRIAPLAASPRDVLTLADLDPLFDHFEVGPRGRTLHTNVVVRLDRMAERPSKVAVVRDFVESTCGTTDFYVSYVGWSLLGLQRLALGIVGGDANRVVESSPAAAAPPSDATIVVLTDVAGAGTGLDDTVTELRRLGWASVAVAPICALSSFDGDCLLRLPGIAGAYPPWTCPYCRQGCDVADEPIHRAVREFHPKVFWDLLSWHDDALLTGHWPSPVTPNHFNLRIDVTNTFETFATSIAERMRNLLLSNGILPGWIDGIICTTGAERARLAPALAETLGVDERNILAVPSDVRAMAAGPGIKPELAAWVESDPEAVAVVERIANRNVVLLDQAAHHFRTMFALRKLTRMINAHDLAFTVFVDRSGFSEELVTGLHYFPLYRWQSPPSVAGLCPCGRLTHG